MIVGASHAATFSIEGVQVIPVDAAMIDERFEQLMLPSLLEEMAVDVYLNTAFSVPAVKTTKVQLSIIHDVVFEDRPEYVEEWLGSYLSKWSRFAAYHADHVLTVSDHALDRISKVYGISPSRITRVYNGISPSCFEKPDDREITRVRRKFGLDRPFILYLGSIEEKKGIIQLLQAFPLITEESSPANLVLAGGKGGSAFDLESEIKKAGCEGRVRSLGFVDESDKKPLLKMCSLFVYPSLYEGFGFPPLEAMALGVPCVVSDQTCLPEIAGDAALVAPLAESGKFADVLRRGLLDVDFRRSAGTAGPARARTFLWGDSAQEILKLCEILGGN